MQEVLTGYRRGSEALAQPGEPRPEPAPGSPKLRRCEAKAADLGVSVMTVRRMIWRFEAGGPEGLVDQRGQRRKDPLAGADPRWLDMARQVLAEHAQASKPTQDLILAEVAARLDAEHGEGAVPLPRATRARALLREITRGTSAFGGTKAKREIGTTLSVVKAVLVFPAGGAGGEDAVNLDGQGYGGDDLVRRQPRLAGLPLQAEGAAHLAEFLRGQGNAGHAASGHCPRTQPVRHQPSARMAPRHRAHTGCCPALRTRFA